MNTIKFRGKRVDNGEWWSGYYVKKWIQTLKNDGRFEHYIINQVVDEEGMMWNESFNVFPETVGQFTGLTDNNGNEIYEGDIVHCWGGEEYMGIWEFNTNEQVKDIRNLQSIWCSEYSEVIGNIHENPELLKGEKK